VSGPGATLRGRIEDLLIDDEGEHWEREARARLVEVFASAAPPPDPDGVFPRYPELHAAFLDAIDGDDPERLDEAFLELYAHVHMHEAPYTQGERRRVDEVGGYWAHAGGISPIVKAAPWIGPATVSADLGAGNGLQGLLMQRLYPHRRTLQIEISSRMVAIGRRLQEWLGIPDNRVEWVVGDVLEASVFGVDFLYLYRPVRPQGPGRTFYERLASELEAAPQQVVVFSVADCLRDFLGDSFEVFYCDGHLTCFRGPRCR
jgi:hypothetical protein